MFYIWNAFYSSTYRNFSKIDPIVGHKTSLSRYKSFEITPYILSDSHILKQQNQQKSYKLMKTEYISTEWKPGQD